ncbi:MAG: disulfide bond formation protein DsbA [Halioglobus sp.]|nr:disulfide bond formation protein DsbA [Halioglobus sp.]|tara:strand:- start:3287 stop:3943 length:657 start_codon:yes stop_codon:yes gene_type:complete
MIKRLFLPLSLLFLAMACSAQDSPTYVAGQHYDVINSQVARTAPRDKIEVAEFFWYGCGHCYTFEPMLQEWKKTLPDDVAVRPIPAVWRDVMELHARAYFTAEALGVVDTVHPALFQAMHVDRKRLGSEEEIAQVFVANGVAREDFDNTFGSFGVSSQVRQAMAAAKGAGITGTPAMMVEGKYHISAGKAGSQADMLKVADFLVEKERAARAAQQAGG